MTWQKIPPHDRLDDLEKNMVYNSVEEHAREVTVNYLLIIHKNITAINDM